MSDGIVSNIETKLPGECQGARSAIYYISRVQVAMNLDSKHLSEI